MNKLQENLKISTIEDFKNSREFFEIKINASYTYILSCIIVCIITFFIWAAIFDYDIITKASFRIRPEENVSTVNSLTSGIILEKKFKNGQQVNQGQILLTLNTQDIEEKLFQLTNQQSQYEKDLQHLIDLKRFIKQDFIDVDYPENEVFFKAKVFFSEKSMKENTLRMAKYNYESEAGLSDSFTYEQKLLQLKTECDIAENDLDYFISQFNKNLFQEEKSIIENLNSIKTQISEINLHLSYSKIAAPISGTIEELAKFNLGDFITSGESLFKIIPSNNKFMAELYIAPQDIADIKVGEKVKLKIYALNSSEYGQAEGQIIRISSDTIYDEKENSFYIADVEIKTPVLNSKTRGDNSLKYGMTGEARIITHTEKLLYYIFKKLNLSS